jgi:hypothetical protein
MTRTFEIKPGKRAEVPLLVGLFGASSSGKTYSALRLATGIQRVRGGKIVVIDTESRRALHYADQFQFDHMEFTAPFAPSAYLEAIKYAVGQGARVIVIDSASHMHEGEGGMLEQHAAAKKAMGGTEAVNFAAWVKPKQEFQAFKNGLLQLNAAIVFCFRGKQKVKPAPRGAAKKDPIELGWMPIINDELTFEMTVNALLEPASDGEPTWDPSKEESKARIKLPKQFRSYFLQKKASLDEADGEMLARWASGGDAPAQSASTVASAGAVETFGKKLVWDGAQQWAGKPLESAPLEVLNEYAAALSAELEATRGDRARNHFIAHIGKLDAIIATKEPQGTAAAQ